MTVLFVHSFFFFFFNDPATTEIYPLSLHDALPISVAVLDEQEADRAVGKLRLVPDMQALPAAHRAYAAGSRSEEHTSELQSHLNLVCRLLLEKKKKTHHIRKDQPPTHPIHLHHTSL